MKESISDELYSEIIESSNVGRERVQTEVNECETSNANDLADPWYSDESFYEDSGGQVIKESEMDREWQKRRNDFHTLGYRDGLIAGKEAAAQQGFNVGFKDSVFTGYNWGIIRGITSAMTALPDGLMKKLVENEGTRKELHLLHESVQSTSSTTGVVHGESEKSRSSGSSSDPNLLVSYSSQLQSLLQDSLVQGSFKVKN